MFVAKFFRKEHKLGSYKGKTILDAKCPLLIFSLDVDFYLAFHVEGKNQSWKLEKYPYKFRIDVLGGINFGIKSMG